MKRFMALAVTFTLVLSLFPDITLVDAGQADEQKWITSSEVVMVGGEPSPDESPIVGIRFAPVKVRKCPFAVILQDWMVFIFPSQTASSRKVA